MNATHRDHSEAGGDFNRVARFFPEDAANVRERSTWCLGRIVDWKWAVYVGKQQTPFFTDDNAHLWLDGFGNLAGFVVSESGDAGFAILTQRGYARNLEADIKRVCTHGDFRQRGFARAAIVECLYRLKALGLRSAYITGYSQAAVALWVAWSHRRARHTCTKRSRSKL